MSNHNTSAIVFRVCSIKENKKSKADIKMSEDEHQFISALQCIKNILIGKTEKVMNTLKINDFLFNWNPDSSLILFSCLSQKIRKPLIFSHFLFNSNSESVFCVEKRQFYEQRNHHIPKPRRPH